MKGIQISVNGRFLTLNPNTKIKFILKSPMFATKEDTPSRSYNFSVPALPNGFVFQFAHLVDSKIKLLKTDAELYLFGKFWKKCILYLDKITAETLSVFVVFDKGVFTDIGKRKIRDFKYNNPTKYRCYLPSIAYKEYEFGLATGAPSSGPGTTLIVKIAHPESLTTQVIYRIIYNAAESITTFLNRVINSVMADYTSHGVLVELLPGDILRFSNTWGNGQYPDVSYEVPDIDFYTWLQDPVETSGYFANTPFQQTNHVNEVVNNAEDYDYIFYPVYVPNYAATLVGNDFTRVINDWYPIAHGVYSAGARGMANLSSVYRNSTSPSAYAYKVIQLIHQELNVEVIDEFWDDELKKLVLFSPVILDYNWNNANTYSPSFLFSDILPDVTYGELMAALNGAFGLILDFSSNKNKVRLVTRKQIINATEVEDWSNKLERSHFIEVNELELKLKYNYPDDEELVNERLLLNRESVFNYKGIVYTLPPDSEMSNKDMVLLYPKNHYEYFTSYFGGGVWSFVAEQLNDSFSSLDAKDYNLGFSTLFSDVFSTIYKLDSPTRIQKWLLPYTKSWPYFISKQLDKWPVRFLFYRGFQPGEYQAGSDPNVLTPMEYPLAHYHNYNYLGEKIGNYSLALYGEDGLINVWHSDWLRILKNGGPFKFQVRITAAELMNLNMLMKKRLNNQHYLLDEVEVTVGDEIEIAEVKAYKL